MYKNPPRKVAEKMQHSGTNEMGLYEPPRYYKASLLSEGMRLSIWQPERHTSTCVVMSLSSKEQLLKTKPQKLEEPNEV